MAAYPVAAHSAGFALPDPIKRLGAVALVSVLALVSGVLAVVLGPVALVIPASIAVIALVVFWPARFALVLMLLGVIFEPNAIDWTLPFSELLWQAPPGVTFPLTISPFEILLLITAGALVVRVAPGPRPKLPLVIWLVPVVMVLGVLYGLRGGAPNNFIYHEIRGLIFAAVAFFVVWRMPAQEQMTILRWLVVASSVLGTILLARYLFYIRGQTIDVPLEFAFAHEDAVFLAFGFVLGLLMLIRAEHWPPRLFFLLHNAVVLSAMFGSSRRAATLALLMGLATVAWMMLPRRPLAVLLVSIPCLLAGSVYLAAYWNTEYGATAQPARAIRSQIAPSERDESSDDYRDTEQFNVVQTIRVSRVFGVGFGKPFAGFVPLPDLSDFWPLQYYTPHQNVLWLWLKMGVLGITVFMATWVLAMRRVLVACREAPQEVFPIAALLVGAGLMMYLAYAKVDLAFPGPRSGAAIGALIGVAYRFPLGQAKSEGSSDQVRSAPGEASG